MVGAELRSDRAAEPLDAARTALLRVNYNSISPAPWDAKLGPVPAGETLRWVRRWDALLYRFKWLCLAVSKHAAIFRPSTTLPNQPCPARRGPSSAHVMRRALSQVHPSGGLVPRLLLLVTRRYPLQHWCRSTKQTLTPKLLAAAQQRAERQQEQVGVGG